MSSQNTELVTTESLLLGEMKGYFPWENTEKGFCTPVVTILVFNLLIHNLVLCVFLFKDTLFNIYHQFINMNLMANSTVTCG